MYFTDEDTLMLNNSIMIIRHTLEMLRKLPVEEAKVNRNRLPKKIRDMYSRKDKKDTLWFDIVAEKSISLGNNDPQSGPTFMGHYPLFQSIYSDSGRPISGVVITEERGKVGGSPILDNTPVIISDPTDKSSYLKKIISRHGKEYKTMGEVFDAERKRIGDGRARIEACNASVTLLKDDMIKYSVILNLFTDEVFVAYRLGVFYGNIHDIKSIDDLTQKAGFKEDDGIEALFYCEGSKYENNRKGTHLRFLNFQDKIRYPGGPNRFTYLLEEPEGKKVSNVGVIAHNGEKIQESLPNIAVALFSQGELAAYKLFCDPCYNEHRGGKVLTPNLKNSIYDGLIVNHGIDLKFLNNHAYPSEFRDTTVITPQKNDHAMTLLEGMVGKNYAIRIV